MRVDLVTWIREVIDRDPDVNFFPPKEPLLEECRFTQVTEAQRDKEVIILLYPEFQLYFDFQ